MLSNDTGKLYRTAMYVAQFSSYEHRYLKEHLTGDQERTLCGLEMTPLNWEVIIGYKKQVGDIDLKKCKKCLKIKEKYNAEVY